MTATGNSNHLNHSSFVEDRGMWWVYHWGFEVTEGEAPRCLQFRGDWFLAPYPRCKGNGISRSDLGDKSELKGHRSWIALSLELFICNPKACVSQTTDDIIFKPKINNLFLFLNLITQNTTTCTQPQSQAKDLKNYRWEINSEIIYFWFNLPPKLLHLNPDQIKYTQYFCIYFKIKTSYQL